MNVVGNIFTLLGALGVFLFGMRVMSDGLQKAAGNNMRKVLGFMTSNRFFGVMTGFIVTALIQSSSATTVMLVSFVNASLINLTQAIGVIMGANIGTTVTTWIVSSIGFKFKITSIALPVIGIGLPFLFSKIKKRRDIGEILIGFGLLFLGLMFLKNSVPDIKDNPEVMHFLTHFTDIAFPFSFLIFVVIGTILTIVVQSSSAAMAITVTIAAFGWINFETAAAIILGENIGTTITAYLASIGTNISARRTARAHMVFNLIGVIWIGFLFKFFVGFNGPESGWIYKLAPWNPALIKDGINVNLPLNLSLFHTIFNILNTLIFLPFIPQFSKLITKIVKEKPSDMKDDHYKLEYMSSGLQDTAQLNILKAQVELNRMGNVVEKMFLSFVNVFKNPKKDMSEDVKKVKDMEELTDQMQEELTMYLVNCSKEQLSEQSITNVNSMMRIVNELENIGDSCYKLILLTKNKYNGNVHFAEQSVKDILIFTELISEFISIYQEKIDKHIEKRMLKIAYQLEAQINNMRDKLKKESQERLQQGADVKSELLFMDILKHLEHIGDNSLNITESLRSFY